MKSKTWQIICIGSTLIGVGLVPSTTLLAHEKRFHVPKKIATPQSEEAQPQETPTTVIPSAKVEEESSNITQKKVLNSVSTDQTNKINIILQPGELVLLLLLGGTFLLFYVKRWMYR